MNKKISNCINIISFFLLPFFIYNFNNGPFEGSFSTIHKIMIVSIVMFSIIFLSHIRTFKSYSLSIILYFISYLSKGYIIFKSLLLICLKYSILKYNDVEIFFNVLIACTFVIFILVLSLYKSNFIDLSIKDNAYDYINSDQYRTTVHEVGHLICYRLLSNRPKIKVKIVDTKSVFFIKNYLGYVEKEEDIIPLRTKSILEWEMKMLLAGKELELFILGDAGSGARSDFKKWNDVAKEYLSLGFGDVFYDNPKNDNERKINHITLSELKKKHENSLKEFFDANKNFIEKIIEVVYIKKELNVLEVNELFNDNINQTASMKVVNYK